MPIKKSQLYSSLWSSCDELRGGMDASQYKDYVLVLLFVKYVSDKYAGQPYAPIAIPKGASFADMVQLKGKTTIGDDINKLIIGPLFKANNLSSPPDFNDATKLGAGKEMVDKLTRLIAIFENPELDFSKNRADGDDLLGDAYEYLMRHFATESGKSKGQFYTPAEVSRVMAQILGIREATTTRATTVYDPTCGSGSLLLKVAAAATAQVTLYGQEKDAATAVLARMNMILHHQPEAEIKQGNTLASPAFRENSKLKTFDYVVANPPFSDKRWSTGFDPLHDEHERFVHYGVPPAKQGDFAYLLHIVRSLKSTGRGACIVPHGVLFRGNAEAAIRKNLLDRGLVQAVIGLPANLFYGTGIPACIVVIDKQGAANRKGVFLIDASKGFVKDGAKNRLREQDIHRIVDTFRKHADVPRYARMVPIEEITDPKNDYNLNLPRYIDNAEPEDLQDIDGHLRGGIPDRDLEALDEFWKVLPSGRTVLFESAGRPGYSRLTPPINQVKQTILGHAEFAAFQAHVSGAFARWQATATTRLRAFAPGDHPNATIEALGEELLSGFANTPLVDAYDVYQHLMDYVAEVLRDDLWFISSYGWKAIPARILETDKKGKIRDKGWACDLLPKDIVVARFFANEQAELDAKLAQVEATTGTLTEIEEEHGSEEGALGALDKIAKADVKARLGEIKADPEAKDEAEVLARWLALCDEVTAAKAAVKALDARIDDLALKQYARLGPDETKTLVIEAKWMAVLGAAVRGEVERVSQTLTGRVRELAARYATPLPGLVDELAVLSARVDKHLTAMGHSLEAPHGGR